jgi:hypothetical protein
MKKIVTLIAILTIILPTLLCSVAVFAVALPPSTPTNVLGDDGWSHNGTFEVAAGITHGNYNWAKDGSLPAIDLKGVSYGLNITQLEIIIPAGTTVNMTNGGTLNIFWVRMGLNGPLYWTFYTRNTIDFPNTVNFSNNVTINELENGSWVQIAQFNKLVNNIPQL